MKRKFEQHSAGKKNFFVHVTCAIDTAGVRAVFDSVLASILQCNSGSSVGADSTTTSKLLV